MRRNLIVAVTIVTAFFAGMAAQARAAVVGWRTDHAAELYLEHKLPAWAGINLRTADFKTAFCINGYYSAYEKAHPKRYGSRTNAAGEDLFHSFACTLSVNARSFHLYLVARAGGLWYVRADRR